MCEQINKSATDALTEKELNDVRWFIEHQRANGVISSAIIKKLQKFNHKLSHPYNAERAYWTEVKRLDTKTILEDAEELDISKFRVSLSPSACELCRQKTGNGKKEFDTSLINKEGYGHAPPYHPNCYCICIPL